MQTASLPSLRYSPSLALRLGLLAFACAAAILAGWTPLLFSIVTVFLFAGPHNWLETRYFLTRHPGRWGKLQPFFLVGFGGTALLTGAFAALPMLERTIGGSEFWPTAVASWCSAVILWITLLIQMRARQNPRRAWGWTVPLAFLLIAATWLKPYWCSMALVYLHPMMALWLLDRELLRSRPQWRPIYHQCLLAIPVLLAVLAWKLWNAPELSESNDLFRAITAHAGAGVIAGPSSHFLVAAHTFLEMIHYGVWIVAMPLLGLGAAPWRLSDIPLARRGRAAIAAFLVFGLAIVLALWAAFIADYPTTRHVYFVVALLHVFAEVPFLLRAL